MFEEYTAYNDCEPAGLELPKINVPQEVLVELGLEEGASSKQVLEALVKQGIEKKGINKKKNKKEYYDRARQEIETFDELGFTDYILLNWDVVKFAKDSDIPVGEGRGSAAGSLVLYILEVVDKDPIEFSLFFERFVSKSRARKVTDVRGKVFLDGSLAPDVDTDVSYEKRPQVIDYIEKAHRGKTARILTFNTLSSKLVAKEATKYFDGVSDEESNRVSDMIPKDHGIVQSLAKAYEESDDFHDWAETHKTTFKVARIVEGLNKNTGVHPSGIAICSQPIENVVPLQKTKDGDLVTGYEMNDVADLMVKFDILGLRTLTIAHRCCQKVGLSLDDIDANNPFIYEKLQDFKHPCGLFQISADTNAEVTKEVKPENLSELSDVVAIGRPGALEYLSDYVENKASHDDDLGLHPELDKILASTKNVILFQEQLMQIAHQVFGLTLEDAETLRRIVGKKKVDQMPAWRDKIFEAGEKQGLGEGISEFYWRSLEASANYSFNKSHSVCYASLAAKTVYLKYKYPAEFFCSILELAEYEPEPLKVVSEVAKELSDFGVALLPPSLEESKMDFLIEDRNIRYGLSSIKGISEKSKEKLKEFASIETSNKFDVFASAKACGINIAALSSLIYAGTLGLTNRTKTVLEAQAYNLLTDREKMEIPFYGEKYGYDLLILIHAAATEGLLDSKGRILMRESRFDTFKRNFEPFKKLFYENKKHEKLAIWWFEKKLLGYAYTHKLKDCFHSYNDLKEIKEIKENLRPNMNFRVVGQIGSNFTKISQAGNRYARIQIADDSAMIDVTFCDSARESKLTNFLEHSKIEEGQIAVVNCSVSRDLTGFFVNNMQLIPEKIYTKLRELDD